MTNKLSLLALLFGSLAFTAIAPGCLGGAPGASGEDSGDDTDAVKQCAAGATVKGIDVSYYQGNINWTSVKNAGYAFAWARVSDGTGTIDSKFQSYWPAMKSAGLVRGVYQFFRPEDSISGQANIMINDVDFQDGDLPPVLDVEVTDGVSSSKIVSGIKQWVELVQAGTGRKPMVYTAPGFWNGISGASSIGSITDLWVANWGTSCPTMANGYSTWQFWQTADSGSVPGISAGGVDHDVFNGSLSDLVAYAKANSGDNGDNGSGGAGGSSTSSSGNGGAGGDTSTSVSSTVASSSSASSTSSTSSGGGTPCSSDGDCNPGDDGSGLRCVSHQCVPGCNYSWECPGNTTCHNHQCQ